MYYLNADICAPYPARIIIDMRDNRAARLSPDDYLILSGILNEKAQEVIEAFKKDISFIKEMKEGEWSCLIFKNKAY